MRSPINRRFPLTEPLSIDRLMDIAITVEREAAERYDHLAGLVEARGETALAATFRRLAALERRHEAGLEHWAGRRGRPVALGWDLPETFAAEDPLSPYQALAIAVRNEEQAFSFYTYLAAQADRQPELRERAEALAREELGHLAQLRRLRRQAYHAEPAVRRMAATVDELHHLAWGLEAGAAELCRMTAERLAAEGRPAAAGLVRRAADEAARWAAGMAASAGEGAPVPPASQAAEGVRSRPGGAPPTAAQALTLCRRDSAEAVDTYLAIAEAAKDEALLAAAQSLAHAALARLAVLRQGMF